MTEEQYNDLRNIAIAGKSYHSQLIESINKAVFNNAELKFKINLSDGKISKRTESKMMIGNHFLKIDFEGKKVYVVYRIIINARVDMRVKMMGLMEYKTQSGRIFRLILIGKSDLGIFFTSHIFDRLLIRTKDEAENRYQAIKLILGEYMINFLSGDPSNMLITIPDPNQGTIRAMIPNRYGVCLGECMNRVGLFKTFVGVDMLWPGQKKIYQAYLNSIDGIHNMKIDHKVYQELREKLDTDIEEMNKFNIQIDESVNKSNLKNLGL